MVATGMAVVDSSLCSHVFLDDLGLGHAPGSVAHPRRPPSNHMPPAMVVAMPLVVVGGGRR
jgi:hypothetical protein